MDDEPTQLTYESRNFPEAFMNSAPDPPIIEGYTMNVPIGQLWYHINCFAKPYHFAFKLDTFKEVGKRSENLKSIVRCCHKNCNYKLEVVKNAKTGKAKLAYEPDLRTKEVHHHYEEDEEDYEKCMKQAENAYIRHTRHHRSDRLPPSTEYPSREQLWLAINDWARPRGFLYKYNSRSTPPKPKPGDKSTSGVLRYYFQCCYPECPVSLSVCHSTERNMWYVGMPSKEEKQHHHFLFYPDGTDTVYAGTSEEQYQAHKKTSEEVKAEAERQRIRYDKLTPRHYLPEEAEFDHFNDAYVHIFNFCVNYIDPSTNEKAPFIWGTKSSNAMKLVDGVAVGEQTSEVSVDPGPTVVEDQPALEEAVLVPSKRGQPVPEVKLRRVKPRVAKSKTPYAKKASSSVIKKPASNKENVRAPSKEPTPAKEPKGKTRQPRIVFICRKCKDCAVSVTITKLNGKWCVKHPSNPLDHNHLFGPNYI